MKGRTVSGSAARQRRRRLLIAAFVGALGLAIAVPGALGLVRTHFFASDEPNPITSVPPNDLSRGMYYTGLQPAPKGDPCVGAYQVTTRGECTHGPDLPPATVDFATETTPVAAATAAPAVPATDPVVAGPNDADLVGDTGAQDAGEGFALAPDASTDGTASYTMANGIACDGDGVSGKRVQVLYVRDAATASRFSQYAESFRTWAAEADAIYDNSAKDTGGSRHLRYVTTADCKVDVREVEIPTGAMADFTATINALKTLGYNRTDRKYMIFGDAKVYCGIGTFAGDDQPGSANRSNLGPSYGRSDSSCWAASVAAHELGHNLGAVNNSAPNTSKAGHCLDEYDIMCYNDSGGLKTSVVCTDKGFENKLDCNHDDYFNTNPSAGSYLATHWNVANSQFLISDGTTDPGTTPSASTTPRPSLSSSPAASPSASSRPSNTSPSRSAGGSTSASPSSGLKELIASNTTANSTRLSWPAAAAGSRYSVLLGGRNLGTVRATAVRVIGMRPNTSYTFQIAIAGTPWTKPVTVRTTAASTATAGSWAMFGNAFTGGAIDLSAGRRADGTPVVLSRRHDAANQIWRLEKVEGTDLVRLRSKATDKCIGTAQGGTAAGTPLVQTACETAISWKLAETAYGIAFTIPNGLVLGVGNARYGEQRLLTLQPATGARQQSWSITAA